MDDDTRNELKENGWKEYKSKPTRHKQHETTRDECCHCGVTCKHELIRETTNMITFSCSSCGITNLKKRSE